MYPSVLLVYVQLGRNPSPTLIHYAEENSKKISGSANILITDFPEQYVDFPGDILKYNQQEIKSGFRRYVQVNKAYSNIAGGYWRYTMERLFSLDQIVGHFPSDIPIIHLESDVILMLNDDVLEAIKSIITKTSVPRYSELDGIASILYSPCAKKLSDDLTALDSLLSMNINTRSDMSLLGLGLKMGIVGELPSTPEKSIEVYDSLMSCKRRFVFDGLAYGQYLFGQDPLHTSNRRISGFKNKEFPLDLSLCNWKWVSNSKLSTVNFNYAESEYSLANIHMHSKMKISIKDNEAWEICVKEANGEIARSHGPYVPDLIHTQKSSSIDRMRIMMQRGILKSLISGLRRRILGNYNQ